MQEVFRFVFLRPPQQPRESILTDLALGLTSFGAQLAAILPQANGRARVRERVSAFVASPAFTPDVATLPLGPQLRALGADLAQMSELTMGSVQSAVEDRFGRPAAAIVASNQWPALRERATDAIVALKIMPRAAPTALGDYFRLFQLIDLVERAAHADPDQPLPPAGRLLRRPVVMPPSLLAEEGAESGEGESDTPPATRAGDIQALQQRLADTEAAKLELLSFAARDKTVLRPGADGDADGDDDARGGPRAAFLALNARAVGRLSPRARAVLESHALDPSREAVRTLVERLSASARLAAAELGALEAVAAVPGTVRVGTTTLPAAPALGFDLVAPDLPSVPSTVGLLRPDGVGDLLVTRNQIIRYEAGEIAHIENVLRSETLQRETRRLERVEQSFTTEVETTREEERDQQSTERNELSREAKNTLKEDEKFKVGSTISGGFGKFVQAQVTIESETQTSQESAAQSASKYAREITERTASKLTERIREERSLTILREFEEKNSHGFDNADGDDHVIGIYQWVERVHQAQVFNYGIRMFFDIMVPEPAAFYLQALEAQVSPATGVKKPPAFTLKPSDITEGNYMAKVATFEATGVEAPPPEFITVSKTLKPPDPEGGNNITLLVDGSVPIPTGYQASSVHFRMTWHKRFILPAVVPDPQPWAILSIGQRQPSLDMTIGADEFQPNALIDTYDLDGETGELPFALHLFSIQLVLVVMEVECQRTAEAYAGWQLRTHEALAQGHLQQEQAYRNQVAELETQQGVALPTRSPDENRRLERAELKRNAVSMITGQYFTLFSAILASGVQEARVDFEEALAEGRYARFFEQAFEWEYMVYEYLDYFWSRRSTWVQKLVETGDTDPEFAAFLRAGYARLRLSVRPDFEPAVFHFLDTGEVWDGGELPPVTRAEWVAYLDDIQARRALGPDEEIPVGDPFIVRLPTTLVRLKPGATLPEWEQTEEGEWVAVDND